MRPVIADALDFVSDLARMLTREALAGVAEAEPLLERLERNRLRARELQAELRNGRTRARLLDEELD